MNPKLSILMGSVGDRLERMCKLYDRLASQLEGAEVEIVVMTDNRARSIGMKRQALLDVARGDYVCFVDDDDEVHDYYGVAIMTAITDHLADSVDVFVFPTLCVLRETARAWKVEHSLDNPNEQPSTEDTFKRKPWFMHPIRRELAVTSRFTDKNWGEDGDWLRPLWDKMRREVKVSGTPLYYYNWDDGKNTSKQEGQR